MRAAPGRRHRHPTRRCASASARRAGSETPSSGLRQLVLRTSRSKGSSSIGEDGRPQPVAGRELDGLARRADADVRPAADGDVSRRHAGDAPRSSRDIFEQALPGRHGPGVRRRRRAFDAASRSRVEIQSQAPVAVRARGARSRRFAKPGTPASAPARSCASSDEDADRAAGERRLLPAARPRSIASSSSRTRSSAPRGPTCCADSVDMLYEVGVDALDSLQSVERRQRLHVHAALSVRGRSSTRKRRRCAIAGVRRALNAAIDRERARRGRARRPRRCRRSGRSGRSTGRSTQARRDSPSIRSRAARSTRPARRLRFTCLVADPAHERLALVVKRQLAGRRRRHARSKRCRSIEFVQARRAAATSTPC